MENQKIEKANKKIVLVGTLLAGIGIGAVVGVLFAPHRGAKTRRKIKGGATDFKNEISDKIKAKTKAMIDEAVDYKTMVEGKVDQLASNFKSKPEGSLI